MTPATSSETYETRYTLPPIEEIRDTAEEILAKQERVRQLCRERNAIILAHHYQRPEVQEVADYVADSLRLSQSAAATGAEAIVFCGVHFMAETAAILCPDKTVLLPDLRAGCSLGGGHHGGGVARLEGAFSGCGGGGLHQYIRGGESGERLLLHVRQCRESGASDSGGSSDSFSARQVPGAGGGAAGGAEQHHRLSRLLPRAQDHPAGRRNRSAGRASGRRTAAASRVRMRQFVHGQGARRHLAFQSHLLPLHGRDAAAHRRVAARRSSRWARRWAFCTG